METTYQLLKNFPSVLYEVDYRGKVIERHVKDAHRVGKTGIEINLGHGEYIYEYYCYPRKGEVVFSEYVHFCRNGHGYNRHRGLYASESYAKESAEDYKREREEEIRKGNVYDIYVAAKRAKANISFNFSN